MMRIDVPKSIRAGRLVCRNRTSLDLLDEVSGEYLVLVPLAALIAICLLSLLRLKGDDAPVTHFLFPLFLLSALLVSLRFTYLAIRRNRRLIRIETGVDKEANRNLTLQVIEFIGWSVIENRQAYGTAATPMSAFTWGQEITVLYDQGGVYLNCRNRTGGLPSARSPYLFGKGERCLKQFHEELERLLGHAPPNKALQLTAR